MTHRRLVFFALAAAVLLAADGAAAHTDQVGGAFLAGFQHPILGWDHLTVMVAVGIWGAVLGGAEVWLLPFVFCGFMMVGGRLAMHGIWQLAFPAGIGASTIGVGLLVALTVRAPLLVAAPVVAAFAMLHGHAHASEFTGPAGYAAGLLVGSLLLHLVGIAIGGLAQWPGGSAVVRTVGAGLAIAGLGLLAAS